MRESLIEIERLVPSKAWDILKTIEIYVNDTYIIRGKDKRAAVSNWGVPANDLPEKEGHVEIYNFDDVRNWKSWQPAILFHEMAHSMHWLLDRIPGSEISPLIKKTYKKAMKDGKYNCVKSWVKEWGNCNKHYASTNFIEYFAETTEAFFS